MDFSKSQRGFSLIEVLIGMVLLGILVTGVLSVTVGTDLRVFADRVIGNSSCRTEANRLLNNFKNKGLIRSYYRFDNVALPPGPIPTSGNITPPIGDPAANEIGIDFTQRWASTGAPSSLNTPYSMANPTASPATIRPHSLIMGAITAIETIYNNYNAAVCTAGSNYGLAASSAVAPLNAIFPTPIGLEDNVPGITTALSQPEAYLRIRAINTGTGAPIACGGPEIHAAPAGESVTPATNVPGGEMALVPEGFLSGVNYPAPAIPAVNRVGVTGAGVRNDLGYEVTITIEHTNRAGLLENCAVTERFQYPSMKPDPTLLLTVLDIDTVGPVSDVLAVDFPDEMSSFVNSNLVVDYSTNTGNQPALSCSTPNTNRSLNFRVINARPGSIFMCRNLTRQRALSIAGVSVITPNNPVVGSNSLQIFPVGGMRQSFLSTELSRQVSAFDNGGVPAIPLADGYAGDLFFNSLYYPQGTYFCNTGDNCQGLPRFDNTGSAYPAGSYTVYEPSQHNSNVATAWDNTFKTNTWVPCEYAQISCATNDTSATEALYTPIVAQFVPGGGTRADAYHLSYGDALNPLPYGCEVHLQIAEIDAAYNVRATEVHEYTHENIPGDRLCYNIGDVAGRPVGWSFYCTTSSGTSPFAAASAVNCPVSTARIAGVNAAQFDLTNSCCIDYPGIGTGTATDYTGGVWNSNPATSEATDD